MSDAPAQHQAYFGRLPCGCVTVSILDSPDIDEWVQKQLADYRAKGFTFERAAVGQIRLRRCSQHYASKPKKKAAT